MMNDTLEDRFWSAGHGEEWCNVSNAFEDGEIGADALYDWITNHGGTPEEAEEMIRLLT